MTPFRFARTLPFLLIGAACAIGCGASDRSEIYGRVTLNGAPLEDGDITFQPEVATAGAQSSTVIKNGEYRLGGEWALTAGTYKVMINGYRPSSDKSNMLAGGFLDKPPETPGIPSKEQFLPKKFNTETTLEKLTVPAGESSIEQNYDLKQ